MGLFSNLFKKKTGEVPQAPLPPELTEENVAALYSECVAEQLTEAEREQLAQDFDTDRARYYISWPFSREYGYPEDHVVYFHRDRFDRNRDRLEYLLGQIKDIDHGGVITLQDFDLRYDGVKWWTDRRHLVELMCLACADMWFLSDFRKTDGQDMAAINEIVEATLSPRDPKFAQWFREYQGDHPGARF